MVVDQRISGEEPEVENDQGDIRGEFYHLGLFLEIRLDAGTERGAFLEVGNLTNRDKVVDLDKARVPVLILVLLQDFFLEVLVGVALANVMVF